MAAFSQASRAPWQWVNAVCQGAAVFLDAGAAELLHWAGGVALLGDCVGVYDLYHDLNPVARDFIAAAPYCHVVVVVTTFLHGRCSERLSSLLSELQPLQCHAFCSQPEGMHAELVPMPGEGAGQDEGEGYSYYGEFQALMRKWINRESGVRVSVEHIPLFHCEVCPGLVTTPSFSTLFPLRPADVSTIQATLWEEGSPDVSLEHLGQVEFGMLSRQLQMTIRSFASAMDQLLSQLGVSEDLFSLGPTSHLIASQLAGLPTARARRKSATLRASLLLVDRTLDLSGPTSHPTDSLADRILSLLPRLPQHSCDVCVDMKPVISSAAAGVVLPGCLAQPQSAKAQSLLRTLVCSRQKEALMEVSRCLLDALSKEGLSARLTGKLGRPSATQLTGFLQQFRSHPAACVSQSAVLQLACAVVQALEGEGSGRWEEAAGREKLLTLGVGDSDSDSVVKQLTSLARKQLVEGGGHMTPAGTSGGGHMTPAGTGGGSHVTLSELLGLAVCMYSMVGEDCVDDASEEAELKESLADLILRHRESDAALIQSLGIEQSHSHTEVLERLGAVFTQLVGLGEARDQLKQFRHTYTQQQQSPLPYHPLLAQVVESIFHPSRPELPDIHHHSLSLAGMLKSGFSLFMSSARPRPNNHPLLLLFVVGGVTCSEVRQIRDIVTSHKSDTQVVVGATRLLTANDIIRQVLCTDPLRTSR